MLVHLAQIMRQANPASWLLTYRFKPCAAGANHSEEPDQWHRRLLRPRRERPHRRRAAEQHN